MRPIIAFFRLIRWQNLLIVLLTQWMAWRFVIYPMTDWSATPIFLSAFNFSILSLSTTLIAAGGYIINDYFDVRIDLINKPRKVIIGRIVSRRHAILLHSLFNVIALLLAAYLARELGNPYLVLIQVFTTVLLWFYSTKFKREFLKGNIVVALMVAFTILVLAFYEPALYRFLYFKLFFFESGNRIINPLGVLTVYAYFAFVLTWMREIVKDMEDFKGDVEEGCITMPIKIGLQRSQHFVFLLGVLGMIPLLIAAVRLMTGNWIILGVYIMLVITFPMMYLLYFLPRKNTQAHYHKASKMLKGIMVTGVLSLFLYWLLQY